MASLAVFEKAPVDDRIWRVVEVCERFAALLMLALLAPLLLVAGVTVALLSGRSPLIAHRRIGLRGSTLWMLKLRTMWGRPDRRERGWIEYIDDDFGPALKQPRDARVTSWFARFCRRHSIDELPQLWHVVRGEMSLVGPRPLTRLEIRQYYGSAAQEVLSVKPGLAGLWQISGRNRLTYDERRRLDLEFVRCRAVGMYLLIVARTLPEIWSGANSW